MAVTYNDGVLHVDNTIISTFATCPLKAAIHYGMDRQSTQANNANLEAGKAIHHAQEYYWLGDKPTKCLEILEIDYKEWSKKNVFDNKRLAWDNIERVFLSWMDKYPQNKLPFIVEEHEVEIALSAPMTKDGSIIYTGTMDLYGKARHGNMRYAVDHKMTGKVDSLKKKEYSITSQMTGYLWLLRENGYDAHGIYINLIDASQVPTSNRKCSTHRTLYEECGFLHMKHEIVGPYQRSDDDIEKWFRDTLADAQQWRDVIEYIGDDFEKLHDIEQRGKKIYNACNSCDWYDYCKMGQPSFWLKNNTVHHEWKPGTLKDK